MRQGYLPEKGRFISRTICDQGRKTSRLNPWIRLCGYLNQTGFLIEKSMQKWRKNGANRKRRIAEALDQSRLFKEMQR